tara:strand:+ start:501 stop:1700 length:1200 start_codon:yes stop_codon:yes gene_type:complete
MKRLNKLFYKINCKLRVRFFSVKFYKFIYFSFYKLGTFFINKNKIYCEDIFSNIISSSYGHITAEIDLILRYKSNSQKKINILIWPTENVRLISKLFPKNKILISDSLLKFCVISFFIGKKYYREVSASLSRQNFSNTNFHIVGYSDYREHDYQSFKLIWKKYLLISEDNNLKGLHYFLKNKLDSPFNFRYAVLQIKDVIVNASAVITDIKSYLLSIKYLKDLGYKVVFGGSEVIPDIFLEYEVLDFKKFCKQNYLNELRLINNAEVVISSPSGYAFLASTLNKKLLYCNQWSITIPQPGKLTLQVPCRIRKNGNLLTLSQQYKYMDKQKANCKHSNLYSFEHPSGEIILSSLKELMSEEKTNFENNLLVKDFRSKYKENFGELISRPSLASLKDFDES